MIELYPDQQEALDAVLRVYHTQPQGGKALVVACTGWGKTILFSSLARELKGKTILIVAHRDELLTQAREKIQMVDSSAIVGKVGGGIHEYGAPITVAGIDTISGENHLKNLHKFNYDIVIWDECHHCCAPKYQKVRAVLPDSFHLGVTATPDRLDKKSLEPLFGKSVFTMTLVEAIQLKRACDIRAIAIQTETDLNNIHSSKNADGDIDFNQRELAEAVDNPERNKLVVRKYLEHAQGRRAITFCVTVEHAESLSYTFNDFGIPTAAVSGSTSLEERKRLYNKLRTGELKNLTTVLVLTEGFDLPEVSCVIMARPTQSRALYTQCIGRGTRLAPNKKDCLILDLTDNSQRLRLTPQNLKSAIGINIKDNETVTKAIQRNEEEEAQEKRALIRKLNEKRTKDVEVNLFSLPEWKERSDGVFIMEVGAQKHRIAIIPTKEGNGLYSVFAKLAPSFQPQVWLKQQPLDWCTQYAEKQAHKLLQDGTALVDRNAAWRSKPIDPESKQAGMLRKFRIEFGEGTDILTKGQASDAIDAHVRKIEERKKAKAQRQAVKEMLVPPPDLRRKEA
jgi:superfamily II DNA or RNA helicase